MATLFVVGIGPGGLDHLTPAARDALDQAEVVVGYQAYLDLIAPLLEEKELVSSGMRQEVARCRQALDWAAAGKVVALVSSGDAGIYGMAGLVLQLIHDDTSATTALQGVEVVVVPGISAVQAAAAVLGAPLMHDFAVISLSDLLTPWELIERRLAAAAAADFVVALYNPRSTGRVKQLEIARSILLRHRPAETPVGIVRHACRPGQERTVTTLAELLDHEIDMFSMVIIGNGSTFVDRNRRMVTPRGYQTRSNAAEAAAPLPTPPSPTPGAVMFCGTGSDVGKSVLTAGFCRILANRGIRVAPFKSQNMALNSAVTLEGGEIGRAQAVQAEACRIAPHTDMNPVLLKPSSDTGSQVIVQGKVVGNMRVSQYTAYKPTAFVSIRESYDRLRKSFQFIVLEGAGSIAEINLKANDIANLKVAEMAGCRAILVADIDRGGVFAQIVGTIELLTEAERSMIGGIIINKFRGDPALLAPGIAFLEERTGIPVLGVVPYFTGFRIPEEDSVALTRHPAVSGFSGNREKIVVGVVKLPRISNFTDFEPLETEADVELRYLDGPREVNGLDLLIIPGSKSTTTDLFFLMERGFFGAIQSFSGMVMGICGGYQMLGTKVRDPLQVESHIREASGLGLLDVETSMLPEKATHMVTAQLTPAGFTVAPQTGDYLSGYEIHMGETILGPGARSFATIVTRSGEETCIHDGAVSADGRVVGTYLHGIFHNCAFRTSLLNQLREKKGLALVTATAASDDPFDQLARHMEEHLDMEQIFRICGITPPGKP